jgi:WD40 repeat protein
VTPQRECNGKPLVVALCILATFRCAAPVIVTASGGVLHLRDAASGLLKKKTFKGHTRLIYSCRFSPDGESIVCASGDCTL